MKLGIYSPTYERGVALEEAGCPIDYLEYLPHAPGLFRTAIRVEQIAGYTESRIYPVGQMQTDYILALRIGTDRPSGALITDWGFKPPWEDHLISWDYESADVIPPNHYGHYKVLSRAKLMGLLNDHRLLRRGCPVDGLLIGRAANAVPADARGTVTGVFSVIDDLGTMASCRVELHIDRQDSSRRWALDVASPSENSDPTDLPPL